MAASKCRSSASSLAPQHKLVFAFHETGPGSHTTFSLCPQSSKLTLNLWVLKCRYRLADATGGDVGPAGCACGVPDTTRPCCPTSSHGLQMATTTAKGFWVC